MGWPCPKDNLECRDKQIIVWSEQMTLIQSNSTLKKEMLLLNVQGDNVTAKATVLRPPQWLRVYIVFFLTVNLCISTLIF